ARGRRPGDAPGPGLPPAIQAGRGGGPRLLPALGAQRGGRPLLHGAPALRQDREAPAGAGALHRAAPPPRRARHGPARGGADPPYPAPLLYARIEKRRPVRVLYTEQLLRRGALDMAQAEAELESFR